jgi:hypothetical protein
MRGILREIAQAGTPAAAMGGLPSFGEFTEFIGMPEVREIERRYVAKDAAGHDAPGPELGG